VTKRSSFDLLCWTMHQVCSARTAQVRGVLNFMLLNIFGLEIIPIFSGSKDSGTLCICELLCQGRKLAVFKIVKLFIHYHNFWIDRLRNTAI
jgi:hypothetical protein